MNIKNVSARQILDSRDQPTIEATVIMDDDRSVKASVPSGASTGKNEAKELRDQAKDFHGQGVELAIKNITDKIAPALIGQVVDDQNKIDQIMIDLDGTPDKSNLGANAILAVSLAVARAGALANDLPLYQYLTRYNPNFKEFKMPTPLMNLLNGGKHANWSTDFQEYMIMPIGAKTVASAIKMGSEIYDSLKNLLKDKKYNITVGDEGGFAPAVSSNYEPLDLLIEAMAKAGYQLGSDVVLALDIAASELYDNGQYVLKKNNQTLSSDELLDFYQKLLVKYPQIYSLEDPFSEDDWSGFAKFTASVGSNKQIVGDDLYVTNTKMLERGLAEKTTNAILIKPNQIGSLTETMKTIVMAQQAGWSTIISHRSGETDDDFIADLSVAFSTGQIKAGAPARGERVAKYNRLMEIEGELGVK